MSPFIYSSDEREPHHRRRIELLKQHPELKKLFGYSWLTSVVVGLLICIQLWIASYAKTFGWIEFGFVSFVVGGTLNHWLGMGIHEASHNLVAKTELQNRWVAIFANIPIAVPSAMSFRRYHCRHHTDLGDLVFDNDLATQWEVNWVGRSPVRKLIWMSFYIFFATLARGFLKKQDRWEVINVVFIFITNALVLTILGKAALGYLLLSTVCGYSLLHPVAAHFIHEHYIWRPGQETYSYYGILNWFNFNVGYHNEHHDLMNIPGWRLPVVKRTAPNFYDSLLSHRSWVLVLWNFIWDRNIGHDSRISRTMKRSTLWNERRQLSREKNYFNSLSRKASTEQIFVCKLAEKKAQ